MADQNKKNQQEPDIHQLLKVRREKLAELQNAGKDPFQITKYNQTHHSLEVKKLYEEHEAEILAGRAPLNTEGMDEAQAREALNADYNERRAIMDAQPIHVSIAGRMMFKRVMSWVKRPSAISVIYREPSRSMWQKMQSARSPMQTSRNPILVISTA